VATDGAFPTRSTMLTYVLRFAPILVSSWSIRFMPRFVYRWVAWSSRVHTERQLGRVFPRLESKMRGIAPRPWLAIHGARDSYIPTEIAKDLVALAGETAPVELWLVPKAKHNGCRSVDPLGYASRLSEFFLAAAPRQAAPVVETSDARPARGQMLEPATSERS
jgi:pimeloyl-ACP methyl ester carboxylesterase